MLMLPEEKIGEHTIRIGTDAGTYRDRLIRKGKAEPILESTDLAALRHLL
ncbi:hypothetical protein [Sphingomonas sp.]